MRASAGIGLAFLAACLACKPSMAQTSEETADFEMVRKLNSRLGYETYLQTYPSGSYAETARQLRDDDEASGFGREDE